MNKFKWWLFNKLLDDIIVQGYYDLAKTYSLIYEKSYKNYVEDKEPVLDDYILKCFERGNKISKARLKAEEKITSIK